MATQLRIRPRPRRRERSTSTGRPHPAAVNRPEAVRAAAGPQPARIRWCWQPLPPSAGPPRRFRHVAAPCRSTDWWHRTSPRRRARRPGWWSARRTAAGHRRSRRSECGAGRRAHGREIFRPGVQFTFPRRRVEQTITDLRCSCDGLRDRLSRDCPTARPRTRSGSSSKRRRVCPPRPDVDPHPEDMSMGSRPSVTVGCDWHDDRVTATDQQNAPAGLPGTGADHR